MAIEVEHPSAFEVLCTGKQWVCYNKEKVPYTPQTGRPAKANDETTWGTYQQATHARTRITHYQGVGREFRREDGITGVDLDKCVDDEGHISRYAQSVIDRLHSYTEYSPSGHGVHIWVYGEIAENIGPDPQGRVKIEMYDHDRYFTWTGKHVEGTPLSLEERQHELTNLYHEVKDARKQAKERKRPPSASPETRTLSGESAYGRGALDRECQNIRSAVEGGRNHQLNASSYNLGQLIAGGELTRSTVEQALEDAASASGLKTWEIERTIRSGLDAGMREPRQAPPSLVKEKTPISLAKKKQEANIPPPEPPEPVDDEPVPDPHRSFSTSDLGNAERLVTLYGKNLRFCYAMNAWLVWQRTHWQEDKDGAAERLAKKTVRAIYREASNTEDDAKRKALAHHALRSESKKLIRDMLSLAQSEDGMPVKREDLDTGAWLLNCNNGTLDLKTGLLRRHERNDLMTKCLATKYNPDAACPQWETFLDTIFAHNTDLIRFVQRALGYALTSDTSEQCFFLMHGTGRNGKSTLLETIQNLMEEYAQSADFKTFLARDNEGIRNDIARMHGKRFVVAKESDKGKHMAEALMKQLTGEDTVTARFLHQEYFQFKPQFKLFLAANHKPEIKGTDTGIWRRVRLIPFNVTIPEGEIDKSLPKKLADENEGILAWLVRGCLDWQREGLGVPDEVRNATAAYQEEMDVIARFISENCVIQKRAEVGATQLYKAYVAWCEETGERPEKQKNFGERLTERGYTRSHTRTGIVYYGIGLATENEPEEDTVNDVNDCERRIDIFEKPQAFTEKTEKIVHNHSHHSQDTHTENFEAQFEQVKRQILLSPETQTYALGKPFLGATQQVNRDTYLSLLEQFLKSPDRDKRVAAIAEITWRLGDTQ